jgi:CBS domain-containing protein
MATVKTLLETKGRQVWYITPGAPVIEALEILRDRKIGALVVLQGSQVVGIFSERDFARHAPDCQQCDIQSPVSNFMTSIVLGVKENEVLENCMSLMAEKHIRHLPVVDEQGQLCGIISIGDVIKQLILEREENIHYLEEYIWLNMI